MDVTLGVVATALGVLIFLQFFTLILLSARLVKLQFQEPTIDSVDRAEAGAARAVLDAARPVLEAEGFRYMDTRRMRSFVVSPSMSVTHCDVYYNAEHDVHAEVFAASMPTPRGPFDVYLSNTYTDGRVLLTVNGLAHVLTPYPRNYTIADAYAPNFTLQLGAHLARRGDFAGARSDPAEVPALAVSMARALLPALEQEGQFYRSGERDGEPVFGLRLLAAIKMGWRVRRGALRRKRMDTPVREGDLRPQEAAPEVRLAAERIAFVRTLCTLNGMRAPRWFRRATFAVSAGAFIALGSWWWGMRAALLIGGVVVVHEAGHWLAMKLANFRDVQVFFVPGMGAATSGEKHEASPLTHLAVYLAGPLPGLLLAVGTAAWLVFDAVDDSAWWYASLGTAVGAACFINLLNLLPVMPLDGGRVVDLFVMGRLPWLRFVFALASGVLLLWAGWASSDNLLRGLGVVYLISIPHQYRMAKISRDLLRQATVVPLANEEFGIAAVRLFDFLSQPAYRKWNHTTKVGLGHAILPRFLGRLPNARETAFGLAIYVACLVVPLAALGVLAAADPARIGSLVFGVETDATSKAHAASTAAPAEDPVKVLRAQREARLAAARPGQRIAVLARLVQDASDEDDVDDAVRFAKLRYGETAALPAPARERAEAALDLAEALFESADTHAPGQAAHLLAEAETNVRSRLAAHPDSVDAMLLVRILRARVDADDKMNALPLRQEIVDLYAAYATQSGQLLPAARVGLARSLDRVGQADAAEKQLLAAADDFKRLPATADYARRMVVLDYAWFLMSHQRQREALKQVEPYLAPIDAASGPSYFQRDAYFLAAVAARMRGDWQEVENRTLPFQKIKNLGSGSWVLDLLRFARSVAPAIDPRATLMLIEAERALGKNERADVFAAALRKQNQRRQRRGLPDSGNRCRQNRNDDTWRKALTEVLAENEKRELKCT